MKENEFKFIYWFAHYNLDSPSVRYRAKYPLDSCSEKHNVSSILIIPAYSIKRIIIFILAYFSALLMPRKDSLIVIQRVSSNFIYSNSLKFLVFIRNKNTIFDLDDADYLEFNKEVIYKFSKNCNTISAGSRMIVKHLSQFNSKIVHTSSPIVDLGIVKKEKSKIFTIGWVGGYGGDHKDGLVKLVFPAIKEINKRIKLVILGIVKKEDLKDITDYFKENKNIQIELPLDIDWNNERDIQKRITEFDIGIATLINNEIQISKSGIKVKQYMNNGVPVLSTNLPENNPLVINGENGYYCSDTTEFKHRIMEFYNMIDSKYEYFSNNARNSINLFDLEKYYLDFKTIKKAM